MDSFFNVLATEGSISPRRVVLNLVLSFVLGIGIAHLYKQTHRSLSSPQSFVVSLVLLNVVVSVAMMVIGNSLARAFGLVGALSVIRFRTVLKDTKDITYIFFSLVIGMACGTANYGIAVISAAVVGLFILILDKTRLGGVSRNEFLLKFIMESTNGQNQKVQQLFQRYASTTQFLGLHALQQGKRTEFSYSIRLKQKTDMDLLVKALGEIQGVDRVGVISAAHEMEA